MSIKTLNDLKDKFIKMSDTSDEIYNKKIKEEVYHKVVEKCRKFDKKSRFLKFFHNPYVYIHSESGLGNYYLLEEGRDMEEISIKEFLREEQPKQKVAEDE